MMTLQRDAYALARQERAVGQRRWRAAQHQGQPRGAMNGLDLFALAGAHEEDGVDAGLLIRAYPLLRLGDAAGTEGRAAADDDERTILARRPSAQELADRPLLRDQTFRFPAERRWQPPVLELPH